VKNGSNGLRIEGNGCHIINCVMKFYIRPYIHITVPLRLKHELLCGVIQGDHFEVKE